MSATVTERLDSPVARTSQYYFILFMSMGLSAPFLAIWLTAKGLSPEQIGIVNATPFLVVILLNQLVGRIADRAADWRTTIVVGSIIAGIGPMLLFFVHDFIGITIVWTLAVVPFLAINPVVDAASVRMAARTGADFARIRLWGSVGVVLAVVGGGIALDIWSIEAFLPLLAVMCIARALVALRLPLFKIEGTAESKRLATEHQAHPLVASRFPQVWRAWFLLPLLGVSLIHGSHMMQSTFGALVWKQSGIPDWALGPLWAIGPGSEIVVMLVFARLMRRFSARHIILFAAIVTVARWVGFALQPPLWGLFLLQWLNMATFGLSYLGVVSFIANWTTESIAAETQAFFQVIRQVVTVAAIVGFGYLTAHFGVGAYYGAAAMGAAGAGLTIVSLLLMHPRHEVRGAAPADQNPPSQR